MRESGLRSVLAAHEQAADKADVALLDSYHYLRRKSMSVQDKLISIIAEQLSVDKDKVVPAASFVDDLGADSLDLVELIMAMEEAFDVEIPDNVAEKIITVQDAINHIQSMQG